MSNIYKEKDRHCDKVEQRDEFYTPRWLVDHLLLPLLDTFKDKTIICPWDDDSSAFVQFFKDHQINVIQNTWGDTSPANKDKIPTEWDFCISNPPFSMKQTAAHMFAHKPVIFIGQVLFMTNKYWGDKINAGEFHILTTFYGSKGNIRRWLSDTPKGQITPLGMVAWTNKKEWAEMHQEWYKNNVNPELVADFQSLERSTHRHEVNEHIKLLNKRLEQKHKEIMEGVKPFHPKVKATTIKQLDPVYLKRRACRHFVYIHYVIWELYQLGKYSKRYPSISCILAEYIKKNNF